jgi:hypothetical protein
MTKEQLAALLNGRQYRNEITADEEAQAKAAGLLVIFGSSDDLVEFMGATYDDIGAYGGTTFRLCPEGLLPEWPEWPGAEGLSENEAEDYFRRKALGFVDIEAKWDEGGYSWVISPPPSLPHAVFNVLEDSDNYCRGIVIAMADLKS